MSDRREYPEVRARVEDVLESVERMVRYTKVALTIMFLVLLGGGGAAVYFSGQNATRIDDIQSSRQEASFVTCQETTRRQRATLDAIKALTDERLKTASAAEVKRLRESEAGTRLIIEALVPARPRAECAARAKELTKTKPSLR